MGCNCKKTSKNAAKYSDGGEPVLKKAGVIRRLVGFIEKAVFLIIAFCLIIIISPFFFCYMAVCVVKGKRVRINFRKFLVKNVERK